MPTQSETYQGSLTRGILSPRESRADMVIHVTGLDGARDSLKTAIDTAIATRLLHPDDVTIPLRYATARWRRGADLGDNAEALVFLEYDKRRSGEAGDGTQFSNIADVTLRFEPVMWWGDDLSVPATAGVPEVIDLQSDPTGGNSEVLMPRPKYINVPIMDVFVPVVLSSSPINSVKGTVGKVNASTLTLSGTSFDQHTILFVGLRQRATKIEDGASVTYEFSVGYSFSIREDGWYSSKLVNKNGAFAADKELIYKPTAFPVFPIA